MPVRALLAVMAHPGDYEQMTITEQTEVTVPGSYCGYVSIPFAVVPKEGAMGLLLEPAESISWREIRFACDGRQRGEPINAYRWNSDFSNTYDVRFETEVLPLADCRPEMAVNGCSRICSAEEYGWVSDPLEPLPQQLTLEWTEPHNIGQIQLVFDTDLTNPSYSYLRQADAAGTVRAVSYTHLDVYKRQIVYMAAISGIDSTLYEAAIMDGATRLQRIRYITLPCIMGTIIVMLIMRMGSILSNGFEQVYLLSNALVEMCIRDRAGSQSDDSAPCRKCDQARRGEESGTLHGHPFCRKGGKGNPDFSGG